INVSPPLGFLQHCRRRLCYDGAAHVHTGRASWREETGVDLVAVVDQVIALLRQRGRVAYRTLKVQFNLDNDALEALKDELLYAQKVARDEDERILVWTGDAGHAPTGTSAPSETPVGVPLTSMLLT